MKRRDFSIAAMTALAATQFGVLRTANAQQLGAVKMMIPANPGGGWDMTGRALRGLASSGRPDPGKTPEPTIQPRPGWIAPS